MQPKEPINDREWAIYNRFKKENTDKKQIVLQEYQTFAIPDVYGNEWTRAKQTYESYLRDDVIFSPADHDELERLYNRLSFENTDGTLTRLNSSVMSSADWYASFYDLKFFDDDFHKLLKFYLQDATILVARVEASGRWIGDLRQQYRRVEEDGLRYIIGIAVSVVLGLAPFFTYWSIAWSIIFFALAFYIFNLRKKFQEKKKQELLTLEEQISEAQRIQNWHLQKANEHELVKQQGNRSTVFFFSTLWDYVVEGRASSLEQAINLYYHEQQQNALLDQQERMLQQQADIAHMTRVNTFMNIFKD